MNVESNIESNKDRPKPIGETSSERFDRRRDVYIAEKLDRLDDAERRGGAALSRFLKYGSSPKERRIKYAATLDRKLCMENLVKKLSIDTTRNNVHFTESGVLTMPAGTQWSVLDGFLNLTGETLEADMRATAWRVVLGLPLFPEDEERQKSPYYGNELIEVRERHDRLTSAERRCSSAECDVVGRKMECNGCRAARYCGEECQKRDWEARHRVECKFLSAAAAKPKRRNGKKKKK